MTNETKPVEKQKRKTSTTNLLLAVVAVLALLGVGMGVYNFVGVRDDLALPTGSANRGEPAALYREHGPQDFTVNLADSDQRRYLKVTVTLAFEEKRLAKELEQRNAQIRDLIISCLRRNTARDVEAEEGTQRLREAMIRELNAALTNGEIRDIYFTDFLVQ